MGEASVANASYRLYLRRCGEIACRYEFTAEDDASAREFAERLAEAASDVCDAVEVWQGGRVVRGPERVQRSGEGKACSFVSEAMVAAAEAVLESGWAAARSKLLPSRLEAWKKRPHARLERVIRNAVVATGAHTGNIQLHDDAGNLRIAAHYGHDRDFLAFFAVVNGRDTSCGCALESAERVIVKDVATSPIFHGRPTGAMMLRSGLRSTYSTPLVVEGAVRGVISTHRNIAWSPDASELRLMDGFVAGAASVLDQ
jgi:GAF domain